MNFEQIDRIVEGRCIKKPLIHRFLILEKDIEIMTIAGKCHAKKGDYLIIANDTIWPVTPEYFKDHYDVL